MPLRTLSGLYEPFRRETRWDSGPPDIRGVDDVSVAVTPAARTFGGAPQSRLEIQPTPWPNSRDLLQDQQLTTLNGGASTVKCPLILTSSCQPNLNGCPAAGAPLEHSQLVVGYQEIRRLKYHSPRDENPEPPAFRPFHKMWPRRLSLLLPLSLVVSRVFAYWLSDSKTSCATAP